MFPHSRSNLAVISIFQSLSNFLLIFLLNCFAHQVQKLPVSRKLCSKNHNSCRLLLVISKTVSSALNQFEHENVTLGNLKVLAHPGAFSLNNPAHILNSPILFLNDICNQNNISNMHLYRPYITFRLLGIQPKANNARYA